MIPKWRHGVIFKTFLKIRYFQILIVLTESCIAFPASWTSDLISFLRKMMSLNPTKRMASIDDVKNHPYTGRINFEAVLQLYVF